MAKVISISKNKNSLIPVEGNGSVWSMRKPKSKIRGISLDGSSQYGDLSSLVSQFSYNGHYTIYFKTGSDVTAVQYILGGATPRTYLAISSGNLTATLGDNTPRTVTTGLVANTKYHVVIAWTDANNDGNGTMDGYVNSVKTVTAQAYTTFTSLPSNMNLGSSNKSADWFGGKILDFKFGNNIPTQSQRDQLYNNGRPDKAVIPEELLGADGANLHVSFTNHDFDTYTPNGTGGTFANTASGANENNYSAITCIIGKKYSVSFTSVLNSGTQPSCRIATTTGLGGTIASITVADGVNTLPFAATATTHYFGFFKDAALTNFTISNDVVLTQAGLKLDLDFSQYYKGDKYVLDKSGNNNHCEMIANPDEYESKYLVEENKIADEVGTNNLQVYGNPTSSYLGSLKSLDFGTNTDKYLESTKTISGTIEYLIAYRNSLGISVNNSQTITTDNVGSIVNSKLLIGKNGVSYFSGQVALFFASLQTMTSAEKLLEVNKLLYLAKNMGVWKGTDATAKSDEITSGTCVNAKSYYVVKTETDHFGTGVVVGDTFVSVGTEVLDSLNTVQLLGIEYSSLEDTNFIGTIYQEQGDYESLPNISASNKVSDSTDFRYYDSTNNLIYAPLPITMKDDMVNSLDVSGSKVVGTTDNRQFELGLDKLMFTNQKIQQGGIAVSVSGSNLAVASIGDAILMKLVNPASGRVLGYSREVIDTTHWTHRFYVDDTLVDTKTNITDEFTNSDKCDLPIDVSGSQLTISPSDYILDDLIVDGKKYVDNQFRTYYLADKLEDTLNEKIIVAPIRNFNNSMIFSVESTSMPAELQSLADSHKDIQVVTKYTA